MPSLAAAGRPTSEFGPIIIISAPRVRRTCPLGPVRIVSPGFSMSSRPSETCVAPELVTQTSPENLLTSHGSPSAANAAGAAPRANAAIRAGNRKRLADMVHTRGGCCLPKLDKMFQESLMSCA